MRTYSLIALFTYSLQNAPLVTLIPTLPKLLTFVKTSLHAIIQSV